LSFLRVRIVDSRVDLRRRKIATRSQLRRIQLHDYLTFVQAIAFPRQNFPDAAARSRAHVCFIHFDRSGDGVFSRPAARQ
jgi:hypothetical protein